MSSSSDAVQLSALTTEFADSRFDDLDLMSVAELATIMNEADATVPAAVQRALPQIVPAIEAVVERMQRGGRLIYVGAGTSGRIAVMDASECGPTFNTWPGQVSAIVAGGVEAIVSPQENAEDDGAAGAAAIAAAGVTELDTVVGLASSGRTPYVLRAVEHARELGALTVGISCNTGSALGSVADFRVEVVVGPEVLSGSTRLKAGTAQKLVLNMFSTITMIRLGKTYRNLMVEVRPTNSKLRQRAVGIVARIAGTREDQAEAALAGADWSIKKAVLILTLGLSADDATARLDVVGDNLRSALEVTR